MVSYHKSTDSSMPCQDRNKESDRVIMTLFRDEFHGMTGLVSHFRPPSSWDVSITWQTLRIQTCPEKPCCTRWWPSAFAKNITTADCPYMWAQELVRYGTRPLAETRTEKLIAILAFWWRSWREWYIEEISHIFLAIFFVGFIWSCNHEAAPFNPVDGVSGFLSSKCRQ